MTTAISIDSLYATAKIVLWVEDPLTRTYLKAVLGDPPEIAYLIGGSCETIQAVVEDARKRDLLHVFGLRDRDFARTNLQSWSHPDVSTFKLVRHEIENYALDINALLGSGLANKGRSVDDIQKELDRLAKEQMQWLAYRRVLSDMRTVYNNDFPSQSKIAAVPTIQAAEQQIITSKWYQNLPNNVSHWSAPGAVRAALQVAVAMYQAALMNGDWLNDFSGKELFRQLRGYVYQPPQKPGNPDSDLAQAVGDWQFTNNGVPTDLQQLRTALRARVGLPP